MNPQKFVWLMTVALFLCLNLKAGDVAGNASDTGTKEPGDSGSQGDVVGNGRKFSLERALHSQLLDFQKRLGLASLKSLDGRTLATISLIRTHLVNLHVEGVPTEAQEVSGEFHDPYGAATSRAGDLTLRFNAEKVENLTPRQFNDIFAYHLAYLVGEDDPRNLKVLAEAISAQK